MKANYHTHTYRCRHAEGNDEQYVKAAIDAGLQLLGFSDHMPIPGRSSYDRMTDEEMKEYLESIKYLREKYQDKIKILTSFECEWFSPDPGHLQRLREKSDYLIFANHERLTPGDLYDYTFYADDDDIVAYCQECEEALSTGLFDIFAHPEYFMTHRTTFSPTCLWSADSLAQSCLKNDVIIEINLKGFEKQRLIDGVLQPIYPIPAFWQAISKYPVKVIFGCDAHYTDQVFRVNLVDQVLAYLGNPKLQIIDFLEEAKE